MNRRLPHPDVVLRASAWVLLVAVAASGFALTLWNVDAAAWLHWGPACTFRTWTGWTCPGCGMGRALVRIGQGAFGEALASNSASPLLLGAIVWSALRPGQRTEKAS